MLFNIWLIASFVYSLLLLRWLFRKAAPAAQPLPGNERIAFAVIFKNEEKHLRNLLSDFKKQSFVNSVDLYFVNDHSDDESCVLIQDFHTKGIRHILLHNEGHGKKEAIIKLMREVEADRFVLIDADVRISPNFFASWIRHIELHQDKDILQGQVLTISGQNHSLLQSCMQTEQSMLNAITALSIKNNEAVLLSGANVAIRKAWFMMAQPYADNKHIPSGDDLFLLEKAPSVGFNSDQDAKVLIRQPLFLEEYIHQRSRWAAKTNRINLPMLQILGWATFLNMSFRVMALTVLVCSLLIPIPHYYSLTSALALLTHHLTEYLIYKKGNALNPYTLKLIVISILYPFLFLLVFTNSIVRGKKYRTKFIRIVR